MNLAFGDTVAPLQGEPRCDRDQVILKPTGETGQFRNPAVDHLGPPCLEVMAPALPGPSSGTLDSAHELGRCLHPSGRAGPDTSLPHVTAWQPGQTMANDTARADGPRGRV